MVVNKKHCLFSYCLGILIKPTYDSFQVVAAAAAAK